MSDRPRILFVCTANACRSQIAQGLLDLLARDRFEALSAGVRPAGFVHEFAQIVVEETGGELLSAHSKPIDYFRDAPPHLVVTLCDRAAREIRRHEFPAPQIHWSTPDPLSIAGNPDARIAAFRWVRDRLRARLEEAIAEHTFERTIENGSVRRSLLQRVLARRGS